VVTGTAADEEKANSFFALSLRRLRSVEQPVRRPAMRTAVRHCCGFPRLLQHAVVTLARDATGCVEDMLMQSLHYQKKV
jgi:hypothetical protein